MGLPIGTQAPYTLSSHICAKDLGLTYSQVGVLMGWNSFTSFFVNLPGGIIVDMVGKTGLLLGLALALTGLPYFFLGFSPSYMVAMIVVTFVGSGSNLWTQRLIPSLPNATPSARGSRLPFIHGGQSGKCSGTYGHRRGPHFPDVETSADP